MKDLKIPISKMRLRLICWDNYTTSPEIIHLFCTGIGSDNSFVYVILPVGHTGNYLGAIFVWGGNLCSICCCHPK